MYSIILTVCAVLISNNFVSAVGNNSELLAVAVYFRHGDRSPITSFPLDAYFTTNYFPMGFGQLTNRGKKRNYDLGSWFRRRYDSFLPQKYLRSDVYVLSTDVDRTLMSASAYLAGLYPPKEEQIWNQNLLWQPIPVHTQPQKEDNILAMKKSCPRFDQLLEVAKKSNFYQQINEEHADLYEYISKNSGMNVTDIAGVKTVRSVFYVYKNYNISFIPAWSDSLDPAVLDYLAGLAYARSTFTHEMKRLRVGPFFNYLVAFFDDVLNNVTGAPKYLILSSHDNELVSVLDSMGAYDFYPPNFAATIIWELRRDDEGEVFVNLLYKKSDLELYELSLDGCDLDCQFDQFKEILAPFTVDPLAWEQECLGY